MAELTITAHTALDDAVTLSCYRMYAQAFTPVRTLAAARHLLTENEFAAEMADKRVTKFIALEDGELAGLATFTDDLAAIAWIDAEFYATKFADRAARGAIFYLAYALVAQPGSGGRVFFALIDAALQHTADAGGIICWDACAYNVEHAVGRINRHVEQHWSAPVTVVDTQKYFVAAPLSPTTRTSG